MSPLGRPEEPPIRARRFEPAIEYVGKPGRLWRCLRDMAGMGDPAGDRHTWQNRQHRHGRFLFSPMVRHFPPKSAAECLIVFVAAGTVCTRRATPYFQHNNPLSYAPRRKDGCGGFGNSLHGRRLGGRAHIRAKPVGLLVGRQCPVVVRTAVATWSDVSWKPITGYGDLKRRRGRHVSWAATYYCPAKDLNIADVEQYTFGGQRAKMMIEADRDGDGNPRRQLGLAGALQRLQCLCSIRSWGQPLAAETAA